MTLAMAHKGAVLVVDEHEGVLWALAESLKQSGFVVITAKTVEAASTVLGALSFAAIVSEIDLSGESGLHLLERARQVCPLVPFFLMGGKSDINAEHLKAKGTLAFLRKPFNPTDLVASIQAATHQPTITLNARDYSHGSAPG